MPQSPQGPPSSQHESDLSAVVNAPYDDADTARQKAEDAEALRRLSSRVLAEELLRRIVTEEGKST